MEPNILRTLSYGMYAIGVKGNNGPSACIVNTVMQVTNTAPLMITLSMSRDNYSCQCIKEHKLFTVAVLSEDTSGAVVGALGFTSGKNGGKLSNIRHKVLREGVPVIRENICCWFLCRMVDCMESPTHTLFLAEIVAGSEHTRRKPMTYDYYRQVIKGGVPKTPLCTSLFALRMKETMGRCWCAPCADICITIRTSLLRSFLMIGCAPFAECQNRHL